MAFWNFKEAKKNENEQIKDARGYIDDTGDHVFNCPACSHIQSFLGYWPTRCKECGQRVGVCNVHGVCDYEHDIWY